MCADLKPAGLSVLILAALLAFSLFSPAYLSAYYAPVHLPSPSGYSHPSYSFTPVPGVVAYVYPGGEPASYYATNNSTSVLTGSTGDLIFAVTAIGGFTTTGTRGWTGIMIGIPPGFLVPDSSQVVASFTNDYAGISVSQVGPEDRYIPGWTLVSVLAENGRDTSGGSVYYDRQTIQFTSAGEWYYIRINGVTAPNVAGDYFFKVLLWGDSGYLGGPEGTASSACALYVKGSACFVLPSPEEPTQFIPTQNWPQMVVEGDIDPALVTGTLRYGGYNTLLVGEPVQEAGMVYAKMQTRIDPATGKPNPQLPTVDGVAYFNATSDGYFEIDGLAAGVYDFYASAAGYPETLIQANVTVLRAQSLHVTGILQPGPVIHGIIYSKHQFGDEPWPDSMYVKVELYDRPTLTQDPNPAAQLVSWSPLPCVAGGQNFFYGWGHAGECGDPRTASEIAFPWHEYTPSAGFGYPTGGAGASYYQVSAGNAVGLTLQDPMGVGPPQNWFVPGGIVDPFHFEFGQKNDYGAPRDLSGMVPQVYATWVNGLTPGRYYVRAWVFHYVQSALDGSTFQEYYFDVTPNEWAGDVSLPIDLRLSSWIDETVHFHDLLNGIVNDPIDTGAGMMSGALVDANGQVWSYNQTLLGYEGLYPLWGPYSGGFTTPTTSQSVWGQDLDPAKVNAHAVESGVADIQFWGINDTWSGENYGIPAGTYTPLVFVLGYLEESSPPFVSISLSGNPTAVSTHLYRGAGFNLTIYSTDWERPAVNRPWVWGNPTGFDFQGNSVGQEIDVGFYRNGTLVDFLGDSVTALADANQLQTSCLYQGGDVSAGCTGVDSATVQADGGGWEPVSSVGAAYQGANGAYFGQELRAVGFVGGFTAGLYVFETSTSFFAPFNQTLWLYPTALPGGVYNLHAYTYGYTQQIPSAVGVQEAGVANIRIALVIGVNVSLTILFKKESIITPTPANMSARVRLFDDLGNLVAEWMSSEGVYLSASGIATAADGTDQFPFGPVTQGAGPSAFQALQPTPEPLNTYNFVPAGITTLQVLLAGLPQVPPFGQDAVYGAPKGGYTAYGEPPGWGGPYFGDPVFTHRTYAQNGGVRANACGFELDCYANPGPNWNATAYFPNSGIMGKSEYQGGWTAEVDFVNWYSANSGSTPNYRPPVGGLLMGESYHIIVGTPARSGISFTEDGALNPAYLGHSMAPNHLGPYTQSQWLILGPPAGGSASANFEVDSNGLTESNSFAFSSLLQSQNQTLIVIPPTSTIASSSPPLSEALLPRQRG